MRGFQPQAEPEGVTIPEEPGPKAVKLWLIRLIKFVHIP